MSEKDIRWNKFIEEICSRELSELSPVQRKAVLCFWYDAKMENGGHNGYMDCYPETDSEELAEAISTIAYQAIADNYRKAVADGEQDEWLETDNAYYDFSPSLCDCLQEYVEANKAVIFD